MYREKILKPIESLNDGVNEFVPPFIQEAINELFSDFSCFAYIDNYIDSDGNIDEDILEELRYLSYMYQDYDNIYQDEIQECIDDMMENSQPIFSIRDNVYYHLSMLQMEDENSYDQQTTEDDEDYVNQSHGDENDFISLSQEIYDE